MNERQQSPRFRPKRKKRGAAIAAVLCFVAAIAIVGTYTFRDYRDYQEETDLARTEDQAEENTAAEESEATNTDLIINPEPETPVAEGSDEEAADAGEEDETEDEPADGEDESGEKADDAEQTAGGGNSVSFSKGDSLLWPVDGDVLMHYSMDKTVYFSTLEQFKYNPAMVIAGEKGDQVISSAPGVVKSIDKTAETGTTVNVDIGGGYELFYGQLDNVAVKTGDYVDSKTVLGYVAEPTIYYSVEGSNVYFEMRKDGQPVDPLDYLVE